MTRALTFSILLALGAMSGGCCRPQCDDYLQFIPGPTVDSGTWPPTSKYRIEVAVDDALYECSGHFESEGNDVWTCSEGIEARSRVSWEMPTFYIFQEREESDIHVKIWREDVLIFDDAIDIYWQRVNDSTSDIQTCDNLGCWAGILRANIPDFDGLPGD